MSGGRFGHSPWASGSWRPPIMDEQQRNKNNNNRRGASRESSYRSATAGSDGRFQQYDYQQQHQHQHQHQQQYHRQPSASVAGSGYGDGRRYDDRRGGPAPASSSSSSSRPALHDSVSIPGDPSAPAERPPWQVELDALAAALRNRSANFLCIQAVPFDHNPTEIIEYGWSYPDPTRPHAPLEEALITMHCIPQEFVKRRNGMLSQDTRDFFNFGAHSRDLDEDSDKWNALRTQRLPQHEILERIEATIQRLVKDKRPLYIVVHGSKRGLGALYDAGMNTVEWGKTAFGTMEEDDYVALDMNMNLSELNALHQEIRLAKDREKAEQVRREQEESLRRAMNPNEYDHRSSRLPQPYQHASRFRDQGGAGGRNHNSSSYYNNNNNNNDSRSSYSAPSQPRKKSAKKKARRVDVYDDGYDEWGQPLSDDEDDIYSMPTTFGPSGGTSGAGSGPGRSTETDIKVIDTVTLIKALGIRWYEEDKNPNAKEPEDPNVRDMCHAIKLRHSPFARNISQFVYDNAGNDAHYTVIALAEMFRWWTEAVDVRRRAADAVPDVVRTGAGPGTDTRSQQRFDVDASKLDVSTPAPAPPPPSRPPPKREGDDAAVSAERQKKKRKAANVNNSLETLILEFECLRSVWRSFESGEKHIAFIAVDIEQYEYDHNYTTEVGWSILYPTQLMEVDLEGAKEGIIASHFIVDENRHLSNGRYVKHNRDHFLRGSKASEKVDGAEQLMNKTSLASETRIFEKLQKKLKRFGKHNIQVYLVFHDATGDLPVLERWEVFGDAEVLPFFDGDTGKHREPLPNSSSSKPRQHIWTVDTQRLMRAYQHSTQTASIKTMCEELVLHPTLLDKRFHNAGNDAFYTLFGMKAMASGPELSELRKKKQEERKRLPPKAARVQLTSWDQDFVEQEPDVKDEQTAAQALRPDISQIPGSQERLEPLFALSNSWHDFPCAYIAIRSVVVDGQVIELAWSVIDRRRMGVQLDSLFQQQGASTSSSTVPPTDSLAQPQRTYHCIDMANVSRLSKAGDKFHKAFGAMQVAEDKDVILAEKAGAQVLPNGTVATTQKRMARQLRAVIRKLRQTPGTLYFVFHGPVENTPIPKLCIPNEELPPELQDSRSAAGPREPTELSSDEEKLADIQIFDTSLLFERYVEKVETVTSADAQCLENTNPTLDHMCDEFHLCGGAQVDTANVGNAAHLLLRAIEYMATCNPIHHANADNAAADQGRTQEQLARLRVFPPNLEELGAGL
ncbi:hypothetical protein OC835_002600 [Tilletia horrida]|nr:hypothetical protein OC835_002600 [Tilletia horrida]